MTTGTLQWNTLAENTLCRHNRVKEILDPDGKIIDEKDTVTLLESVIEPFDKVCIEGNNQKQASFMAKALSEVNGLPEILPVLSSLIKTSNSVNSLLSNNLSTFF